MIDKAYFIVCDACGKDKIKAGDNYNEARHLAYHDGWHCTGRGQGTPKDFCPACWAERQTGKKME